MQDYDSNNITQKDLLKLLFDQAQHNATREEVKEVDEKITSRTDRIYSSMATKEDVADTNLRINKLDEKIDTSRKEVNQRIDVLDAKIDTVRTELNANIAEVKTELKHDIASSESRINSRIDGLQTQFDKLDKRIWALAALIIALAFKAEILAWLS